MTSLMNMAKKIESNMRWARNVANGNPHKSGSFLFSVAKAYLLADDHNRNILNDAMAMLRDKYFEWDIEEDQT